MGNCLVGFFLIFTFVCRVLYFQVSAVYTQQRHAILQRINYKSLLKIQKRKGLGRCVTSTRVGGAGELCAITHRLKPLFHGPGLCVTKLAVRNMLTVLIPTVATTRNKDKCAPSAQGGEIMLWQRGSTLSQPSS